MVAQFSNEHQVVLEVRHHVDDLDKEIREEQVT